MIYYINENKDYNNISCEDILFEMMDIQSDIYYSEYVNESAMSSNISRLVMKAKLFIDQLIQKVKNFFAEKKINNTIAKYEKIFKNKSDTVNIDIKILMYDDIADITNNKYNEYIKDIITNEVPLNDVKQKLENDIKVKYHSGNINTSIDDIIRYLKDYNVVYKELNTIKDSISKNLKKSEFNDAVKGDKHATKLYTTFMTFSMYLANRLTSEYIKSCNSIISALEKLASEALKDSDNDN